MLQSSKVQARCSQFFFQSVQSINKRFAPLRELEIKILQKLKYEGALLEGGRDDDIAHGETPLAKPSHRHLEPETPPSSCTPPPWTCDSQTSLVTTGGMISVGGMIFCYVKTSGIISDPLLRL